MRSIRLRIESRVTALFAALSVREQVNCSSSSTSVWYSTWVLVISVAGAKSLRSRHRHPRTNEHLNDVDGDERQREANTWSCDTPLLQQQQQRLEATSTYHTYEVRSTRRRTRFVRYTAAACTTPSARHYKAGSVKKYIAREPMYGKGPGFDPRLTT